MPYESTEIQYQIESDAKQQWRDTQRTRDIRSFDLGKFKELFFEKYFPIAEQEKKAKEFEKL